MGRSICVASVVSGGTSVLIGQCTHLVAERFFLSLRNDRTYCIISFRLVSVGSIFFFRLTVLVVASRQNLAKACSKIEYSEYSLSVANDWQIADRRTASPFPSHCPSLQLLATTAHKHDIKEECDTKETKRRQPRSSLGGCHSSGTQTPLPMCGQTIVPTRCLPWNHVYYHTSTRSTIKAIKLAGTF